MAKFVRCAVVLALMALSAAAQEQTATNYRTDDGQQRTESTDGQGNVRGSYSYVDPNGKTITVRYTAGKDGFQVEGDHLPVAPQVPQAPAPVAPTQAAPAWNPPTQPQQQWNQQQPAQQQWTQPAQQQPPWAQPQPQWNQQPQYQAPAAPQQQWNQQQPAQQQWSPPPQPQWAAPAPQQPQQFAANPALQQLQNFPALAQPHNSVQQGAPSQGGQVSVNQQPSGGFSYTFNL